MSKTTLLRALLFVSFLLRWCIALHPHSGYGVEPLHGDFEAQRHWVEVTTHLPRADWYRNTTDNDLQYWGLDYPPWSAFHARAIHFITGAIAHTLRIGGGHANVKGDYSVTVAALLNTSFGLHNSRGAEDTVTVFVMRMASLVTDALAWGPAAMCFAAASSAATATSASASSSTDLLSLFFLFAPLPQLFIDHGHFQFNSVPAGLILWVIYLLPRNQNTETAATRRVLLTDCACALLSATAVMFKQMSLYYCPAIAVVLLARCFSSTRESYGFILLRLMCTFVVGVAGLVLPLAPLQPLDVLARMFPFQRGLYEDKVANVWCALSPVLKLPQLVGGSRDAVVRICAASTLLCFVPAAYFFMFPSVGENSSSSKSSSVSSSVAAVACRRIGITVHRVAALLTVSALCFFLLAFQVHEKSILMAVVSTAALWACQDSRTPRAALRRAVCAHFMLVAMVSLQPLAVKDKLDGVPWTVLTAACAVASLCVFTEPELTAAAASEQVPAAGTMRALYLFSSLSLASCSVLVPLFVEPAPALPDIVSMLNAIVCCVHFVFFACFWTLELRMPF